MAKRNTWQVWMLTCALAAPVALLGCGDDDSRTDSSVPMDAITADVPLRDGDLPDVPRTDAGDDAGVTPDGGTDTGVTPDGGMDAGDDAMTPDAGDDAGTGMMTSAQIAAVRAETAGAIDPALPIEGAIVTYVHPLIGSDPAGFFVQGEPTGPALYVAVDATTLTPVPAVGDTVSFDVAETSESGSQLRATVIENFMRTAAGADVSLFVQEVSDAADLVSALDDYDSELVAATGTISGAFSFAGTDHVASVFVTAGVDDPALRFRLPATLAATVGLYDGCVVTVGPAPMWRFNTTAQLSAFAADEISVTSCPAPEVVEAAAVDPTTVSVTFSAALDAATVAAGDFAFTGGMAATAATIDGLDVTLTVTGMVAGTDYTVTVTGVTNTFGTDINAAANTAMFTGVGADMGDLLFSEVLEGSGTGNKAIEITNVGAGASNLADCVLNRHSNGSAASSAAVDLTGTLAAGASFVVCNTGIADDTNCDMLSGSINHNGDDAYSLVCGGTVIDTFGEANDVDPPNFSGTNSMGQALAGNEMTLRRFCGLTGADADTDLSDTFDLGAQWDASTPADPAASRDDFSGLGSHCL